MKSAYLDIPSLISNPKQTNSSTRKKERKKERKKDRKNERKRKREIMNEKNFFF